MKAERATGEDGGWDMGYGIWERGEGRGKGESRGDGSAGSGCQVEIGGGDRLLEAKAPAWLNGSTHRHNATPANAA